MKKQPPKKLEVKVEPLPIEKSVPIPPRWVKTGVSMVTAANMKHGDSVFFTNKNAAQNLYSHIRKTKRDAITRQEKGGVRVWCLNRE